MKRSSNFAGPGFWQAIQHAAAKLTDAELRQFVMRLEAGAAFIRGARNIDPPKATGFVMSPEARN